MINNWHNRSYFTIMNPVLLPCLLTLTISLCGCEPQDNELVLSHHNGHTLQLFDHTTVRSIGERNHQAMLLFDGKTVSSQNVGFPLLPEQYPNWVIQNYVTEPPGPEQEQTLWTVYVSPTIFKRDDFDQIVACFEANRPAFDSALMSFSMPNNGKTGRIGRLVYGEEPKPIVFRPSHVRYQRANKGDQFDETLTINPDGSWFFSATGESDGFHMVSNLAQGKLMVKNGQLSLEKPFEINHPLFTVRPEMANLSSVDYLQSFTDSTGKSVLSVLIYPF